MDQSVFTGIRPLYLSSKRNPMSIDDIPLEEIEEAFNSDKTCTEQCSTITSPAPP